jgi:hypothetical protein
MSSQGSGVVPGGGNGSYFWCLKHRRVEWGDNVCRAKHRLGPFATVADAEAALATVEQRNDDWEAEDARWHGEER